MTNAAPQDFGWSPAPHPAASTPDLKRGRDHAHPQQLRG